MALIVSRYAVIRDSDQICRVDANILSKCLWTAKKKWYFTLGLCRGLI